MGAEVSICVYSKLYEGVVVILMVDSGVLMGGLSKVISFLPTLNA
jgi:hypothetical protein